MTMTNTSPPSRRSAPISLIGKSLRLIFNMMLIGLLAWMLLLLLSALGVLYWGWQSVWYIFERLILGMTTHLWVSHFGLKDMMQQAGGMMQLPSSLAWAFPINAMPVEKLIHGGTNAWITCLLVTQFFIERLQFFVAGFGVIVVFVLLGFVDGLVKRDIRKFNNDRESTLFFHRSKTLLTTIFFTEYFLFIVTPINIDLSFCLILIAIGTGCLVQVSTRQFKKYL